MSLGSIAARRGRIDFENLQSEADYRPMVAYSQSKLACIMFGFELQRRSAANGWGISSIVAHPGVARTDLIVNGMGDMSPAGLARRFLPMFFQSAEQAALPILHAATAIEAKAGGYYGPRGTRGNPRTGRRGCSSEGGARSRGGAPVVGYLGKAPRRALHGDSTWRSPPH